MLTWMRPRELMVDVSAGGRRERFRLEQVDIGDLSTDADIRQAVADRMGAPAEELRDHMVLRLPNGHIFLRVPVRVLLARFLRRLSRPALAALAGLLDQLLRVFESLALGLARVLEPLGRGARGLLRAFAFLGRALAVGALEPLGRGVRGFLRAFGSLGRALAVGFARVLEPLGRGARGLLDAFESLGRIVAGRVARALAPLGRGLTGLAHWFGCLVRRRVLEPLGRGLNRAWSLVPPLAPWLRVMGRWVFGAVVQLVTGRSAGERERDHRLALMDALLATPHRRLDRIYPLHRRLLQEDPLFYLHLAVWYFRNGQLRDHQEMFVIVLALDAVPEHREVGLALLHELPPYQVARVVDFIRGGVVRGRRVGLNRCPPRSLRTEVRRYLRKRESDPRAFDGAVLAARKAIKRLYATLHIRPSARAQAILFEERPPDDSRLWALKQLARTEDAAEKARLIREHRLPFRAAVGAAGAGGTEVLEALVESMSPQEVINHLAALRSRGADGSSRLGELIAAKLEQARGDRRVQAFKGQAAMEAAELGDEWEARLRRITEDRLRSRGRIEHPVALLVDASASMEPSLEVGKRIASMVALVSRVPPRVVAFNQRATVVVGGADCASWERAFEPVEARGSTSVGCAVDALTRDRHRVTQIVLVTDGRENHSPRFREALLRYRRRVHRDVRITFVYLPGASLALELEARQQRLEVQSFRFAGDYYSLPELLPLLARPSRLELLMDIMETPLPSR
ncbi:MAG: VWA domain-containing protein [Armatimonadetes bacterium]|nr:VWA domain-containing protein [Armatimonadota bacterium]